MRFSALGSSRREMASPIAKMTPVWLTEAIALTSPVLTARPAAFTSDNAVSSVGHLPYNNGLQNSVFFNGMSQLT